MINTRQKYAINVQLSRGHGGIVANLCTVCISKLGIFQVQLALRGVFMAVVRKFRVMIEHFCAYQ